MTINDELKTFVLDGLLASRTQLNRILTEYEMGYVQDKPQSNYAKSEDLLFTALLNVASAINAIRESINLTSYPRDGE